MRLSSTRSILLAALSTILSACGGSSDTGGTTLPAQFTITLFDGNAQSGAAGKALTVSPSVRVTNNGVPAANVGVTFAVLGGSGSVGGGVTQSGLDGVARVGSWVLGTVVGQNSLTATATGAAGSPVTFTATGVAGPAALLSRVAGDGQSGPVGGVIQTKPAVKLTDSFGNVVAGVGVTFAAAAGSGSVTGASSTTGADGVATVGGWTLGNTIGQNTLTATAAGTGITGNPATFTANVTSGPVASITKIAGDNQTALLGSALPIAPAVRLADSFGNLVANQTVTFAAATGGGTVVGATPATSATGVAAVGGWTLGGSLLTQTLTASASGVTTTFTATGVAGFNAGQYGGNYSGVWSNTTFGSTGTGTASVVVGATSATVTVNVTGNVLGVGGVSNAVRSGPFTNSGASFTGNVSPMGDITATIDAGGHIVASGVNVPNASISRWDATGTLSAVSLAMTYTVTFTSGTVATGTINMTKP